MNHRKRPVSWLKNALLDILVTVAIAALLFTGHEVLYWVIVAYTGLLIALKLLFLSSRSLLRQIKPEDEVPSWLYHVLYAANTALLAVGTYWGVAAAWAVVWGLSATTSNR